MRKTAYSLSLALLLLLALATSASAANTWYGSPTGAGTTCSEGAPCTANYVIGTKAIEGDTVVLAGGDYNITTGLFTPATISIEGARSGTPTRLNGAAGVAMTLYTSVGSLSVSTHVSDLVITNQEPVGRALVVNDAGAGTGVVERVYATSTGTSSTGIFATKGTATGSLLVRNSIGRATAANGTGISATGPITGSGTVDLHSVLGAAEASAGVGIAFYGGSMPVIMCGNFNGVLKNSIARGDTAAHDVLLLAGMGMTPCTAALSTTNSIWRESTTASPITSTGDLRTATPLFVNAAAGDFHPAPGSPIVDAGTPDDQAGSFDLDRNARVSGAAIDIGPYETNDVVAPVVTAAKFAPASFLPKQATTPSVEAAAKKAKGSTVTFNSSEAATITFKVEAKVSGRKKGKSCSTKVKRGKKCTTYKAAKGSFTFAAKAGVNSFKFTGYLNGKPLKAGAYRLTGVPKDAAGNSGVAVHASFKILK